MSRWMNELRGRVLGRPTDTLWLDAQGLWPVAEAQLADCEHRGLSDGLVARSGRSVRLVLSEHLLHHLQCDPALPLADEAAVLAYAQQQFEQYHGSVAQRWGLCTWSSLAGGTRRGVVALSRSDLAVAIAEAGATLRSALPAWCMALSAARQAQPQWLTAASAAVAWVEGGLLCWMDLRHGELTGVQHHRLRAPSLEALDERLTRLQSPGQRVLVLGFGLAPGTWVDRLDRQCLGDLQADRPLAAWLQGSPDLGADFVRRTDAVLSWRGAWLATTALLLALSAGQALQVNQQLAQLASAAPSVEASAPVAARRSPTSSHGADPAAQRVLAEAQAQLAHPWHAILIQVEQAAVPAAAASASGGAVGSGADIQWLTLEHQALRGELRLEGLSPTPARALQMVDLWAQQPGWTQLVLGRFQVPETGQVGVRFELTAKLQPVRLAPPALQSVEAASQAHKKGRP